MNRINWTQVLVFGMVVLVVFLVGLTLLPTFFGGGYWGMGRTGMMGGWCPWCGGTGRFGGGGMLGGLYSLTFTVLGLLIPIGLLGLLVVGGVWLVRSLSRAVPSAPIRTGACPNCDQPVELNWQNCPHCGEEL
ncbi:MAG: hypothetical protein PVH62_04250 [Anaerolineae bacterium]|jgi:hypothetical protein